MLHKLTCHPDAPARTIESVQAQILNADARSIMIEFSVQGRASLFLPPETAPIRTDGLWRTTCFEVFLRPVGSPGYFELNFSPSFAWAIYGFDRYREGMAPIEPRLDPEIMTSDRSDEGDHFFLSADFDIGRRLAGSVKIGLSAVIEETDGTKSYWALAHPPGKLDFHHDACFALEVPALA